MLREEWRWCGLRLVDFYGLRERFLSGFPEKDIRFLTNLLEEFDSEDAESQFDNIDNWRIALVSDRMAMKEYKRIHDEGCCGEFDMEVMLPSCRVCMVGFNYGH